MSNLNASLNASTVERSQRSVFVGNIPYEATEEELKDLFSKVGKVVGFRLVFDRENGKPKGYGFCEFQDQETALIALRNLNQFEFHGRNLRVDTAAGDRSREELRQLQMTFGGPAEESPYGPPCEPAKAPEAISRAVASLPPEQMFELMKQMKLCIQNNPNEARNMLLQNPQLAYALLQAQVVMRIVDPQVAMSILHRETNQNVVTPLLPSPLSMAPMPPSAAFPQNVISPMPAGGGPTLQATSRDIDYRMIPTGAGLGPHRLMSMGQPPPFGQPGMPPTSLSSNFGLLRGNAVPGTTGNDDQERAALIMQVLQLTDDQIALLPPDQKQSVLILREQLRGAQK